MNIGEKYDANANFKVFGLIAKGNCYFALNSNQIGITEIFFKNVTFEVIFTPNYMGKQNVYFCTGKKMKWIFFCQ